MGCDFQKFGFGHLYREFQSTHPRGVRRPTEAGYRGSSPFQSTHPRGVRQGLRQACSRQAGISIHAPTWGATLSLIPYMVRIYFNPRTHVGCDMTLVDALCVATQFQSTHPRGVRHFERIHSSLIEEFQSTHPRGVRRTLMLIISKPLLFQSTHPRGVRQGIEILVP